MHKSQANRARIAARAIENNGVTRSTGAPSANLLARQQTTLPTVIGLGDAGYVRRTRIGASSKGQIASDGNPRTGSWNNVRIGDRSGRNPAWDLTRSNFVKGGMVR